MQVNCPGCGEEVAVEGAETAPDGRVRLRCPGCDSRLLIKINRPDLKVDDKIPTDNGDGEDAALPVDRTAALEALERFEIDVGSGEYASHGAGMRVVVVQELSEAGREVLKRSLIRIPRFTRNPNKIHDATAELPYVLVGLEADEADELEALIVEEGGACVAGPEWRLLDEAGQPRDLRPAAEPVVAEEMFGEADEGLLIVGDADEDEDLLVEGDPGEFLVATDSGEVLMAGDDGEVEEVEGADEELLVAGEDSDRQDAPPEGEGGDRKHAVPAEVTQEASDRRAMGGPRREPDWLASLAHPTFPEPRSRRSRAPAPAPAPERPLPAFEPIELAADEDEPETGPETEPSPFELGPETYEDMIAVVTSDHIPSVEIPADDVTVVTVETMPDQGEVLGVVSVTLELPPSAAAGSRAAAVAEAIRDGEGQLRDKARALGATLIVALRTTASDLSDGTLLVVIQGTAAR